VLLFARNHECSILMYSACADFVLASGCRLQLDFLSCEEKFVDKRHENCGKRDHY
jgi:hypothetical protein